MEIFTPERRKACASWSVQEIRDASSERATQMPMWRKWRRQREARPEKEEKNEPWPRAANMAVPLSHITGQTMFGQLMGALGYVRPFLVAKSQNPRDPALVRRMKSLTRYIEVISDNPFEINLQKKNRTILYETGTMGTEWVKVFWDDTPWSFVNSEGVRVRARMHHGVNVVPIPIEDVYHRQAIQDPMKMQWISHRYLMPKYEFMNLKADGILSDPDDLVENFEKSVRSPSERDQERRMGVQSQDDEGVLEVHEVYAQYDVDEDGRTEEIIFLIHPDTEVILQEAYNTIGVRNLLPSQYFERPYFLEGIGTCWMTESMQDESDATHNMRVNSMHLVTMPIFVGRKTSGLKDGEMLRPGKILMTQNGPGDLAQLTTNVALQWSERSEAVARELAQRATGMSDIMQGMADMTARTGDTLGGQTQRLQQGTRMINSIISGLKDFYRQMGMLIIFHLVEHREEVLVKERSVKRLTDEEIQDLSEVLDMPIERIPEEINFDVRAADVEETAQQKRQDLLFRIQLQNVIYDRLLSLNLQYYSPVIPQEAKILIGQVVTATTRLLERLLEFFDEEEPNKYVPAYEKFEMYSEFIQTMYDRKFELALQQMTGGMYVPREAPRRGLGAPGAQPESTQYRPRAPVEQGGAGGAGEAGGAPGAGPQGATAQPGPGSPGLP